MKQLRTRHRHKQPTPKPPRPIGTPPLLIKHIIEELHAPRRHVDSHRHPQLLLGTDPEGETSRTGANCRRIPGCQGLGDTRIAYPERLGVVCSEVCAESDEEAVEETVEEEDEGEG